MRKFCLMLVLLLSLSMLTGCNLKDMLETDNPPTLPEIALDSSTLTGTVEFVNGYACRVRISEGDSHFDGPYINRKEEQVPGDLIHATYTTLSGAKALNQGDTVTFTYRYTKDVSEKNGDPHIVVTVLTVLPNS